MKNALVAATSIATWWLLLEGPLTAPVALAASARRGQGHPSDWYLPWVMIAAALGIVAILATGRKRRGKINGSQMWTLIIGIPLVVAIFWSMPLYYPSRIEPAVMGGIVLSQCLLVSLVVAALYRRAGGQAARGVAKTLKVLGVIFALVFVCRFSSRRGLYGIELLYYPLFLALCFGTAVIFGSPPKGPRSGDRAADGEDEDGRVTQLPPDLPSR